MDEVILSAEELYFLAKACKGARLNYDYIEMMPDVQQRASILRDACIESLGKKGVVEEFWGEVSVKEEAASFLSPIWNGDFEASSSLITLGDRPEVRTVYCHKQMNRLLGVLLQEDGLHVARWTDEDLEQLAFIMMPEGYEELEMPENQMLGAEPEPEQMIVLKNIFSDGSTARVEEFYITKGWICRKEENGYRIILAEEFFTIALTVLKGE